MKVLTSSTVAEMETNYGTEEMLICKEGLNCVNDNDVIVDTCHTETTTESVKQSTGTGQATNAMKCGGDLAVVSRLGINFGGCSELECEKRTNIGRSEYVENEADFFKVTDPVTEKHSSENNDRFNVTKVGNKDYFTGNSEQDCYDKTDLSEEIPVINIAPILHLESVTETHVSDTETRVSDECQVTSYTEGRIRSSKRIKLELIDSANGSSGIVNGDGKPSVKNATTAVVEPVRSDTVNTNSFIEKPTGISTCSNFGENPSSSSVVLSKPQGLDCQKCPLCNRRFLTAPALETHVKNKHSTAVVSEPSPGPSEKLAPNNLKKADLSDLHKCPVCLLPFAKPLSESHEFAIHLKLHLPKLHTCRLCEQAFTRKDSLERHAAFHEDRQVHYCRICGMRLKSGVELEADVRAHMHTHRIKDQGLHPVPEFLSDYVRMNSHRKGVMPYICNICGMIHQLLTDLLSHLASHSTMSNTSNEGRHSCIVCAKECIWEADVYMLMCRSHPDICSVCGVGNVNLNSHMKIHYGIFYNCVKCNQGFTRRDNQQKHLLSTHSRMNKYHFCRICYEVMESDVLKGHMNYHQATFIPGLPGYFNDQVKVQVENSGNSGPFVCNLCGYVNAKVQLLISHVLGHVRSSFVCRDCGKEYLTREELVQHEKSHIYVINCFMCNEQFSSRADLKLHQRSHFS